MLWFPTKIFSLGRSGGDGESNLCFVFKGWGRSSPYDWCQTLVKKITVYKADFFSLREWGCGAGWLLSSASTEFLWQVCRITKRFHAFKEEKLLYKPWKLIRFLDLEPTVLKQTQNYRLYFIDYKWAFFFFFSRFNICEIGMITRHSLFGNIFFLAERIK